MDTTTLLIIIVVLLLLGGGWYGRGRWSQSSDYQRAVESLAKREAVRAIQERLGELALRPLQIGSYAALVNPPERGRTDVVLTGPQFAQLYVCSSVSGWVG